MRGGTGRGIRLALTMLFGLSGCAAIASDAEFPPAQPPVAATRFKVTHAGEFPIDVYLSRWGDGYVIYAPGRAPLHLISDKKGGFVIQQIGEGASFVAPRPDGSGWNILSPSGPATYLLKQDGGTWILQTPGDLPTLIVPQ